MENTEMECNRFSWIFRAIAVKNIGESGVEFQHCQRLRFRDYKLWHYLSPFLYVIIIMKENLVYKYQKLFKIIVPNRLLNLANFISFLNKLFFCTQLQIVSGWVRVPDLCIYDKYRFTNPPDANKSKRDNHVGST